MLFLVHLSVPCQGIFNGFPPLTFLIFLTVFQYSFKLLIISCFYPSWIWKPAPCYSRLHVAYSFYPLIAACAAHFDALRILLIAVFSAFCSLSISSSFMSITSAPYSALGSSAPFQYVSPSVLYGNFIRWQSIIVIVLNLLWIFSSFHCFVLLRYFILLVLLPLCIIILLLLLKYLFSLIYPLY